MEIELYELKNLCMEMARLGCAEYAREFAPAKDNLSQREAYAQFGQARVRRWVADGMVAPAKSGEATNTKMTYSRAELMAAAAAERLCGEIPPGGAM